MSLPTQRLILLFDGTWNDPQDRTNIYRLARDIHDHDDHGIRQRFFYEPGVGTRQWERVVGGAFGLGLSRNLQKGYDWLVRHYLDDSQIFVFGFSRGAYTARSLVGMIRKCGLLRVSTPGLVEEAEAFYRDKDVAPDDARCRDFRERYSREIEIHFIGVWDTVGALGIPGTNLSEHGHFSWHDTELSSIVKRAYHAVALDEHRAAYDAALWTHPDGAKKFRQLEVEQRWFIGAHANVGGGYRVEGGGFDPLASLAYGWICDRATTAGLKLYLPQPIADAHLSQPRDSYAEFMKGAYRWFRSLTQRDDGRYHRPFAHDGAGHPAVGVTVDPSVWQRWREDDDYRPPTLVRAGCLPPASPPIDG
ncbi:DUF2235 domain-containing protein [Halomonas sp. LR5S13]|uniref:DUF2235 domain-containing protein n=1 Tax=Halomonas rhizosphaerae TaxID=3043296 RepID=UPI0024A7C60A|nr:DUF2235 domain-containing protein [Halomonas rhizosphaerae]MDI5919493.1 DUF2235 domain-containing protein [Halomonas rhizosphaerae]